MSLGIKIPRNALAKAAKEYAENPNAGQDAQLEPGSYLGVIKGMRGVETSKGPQLVMDVIVGGDCDPAVKGGKVTIWFSFDEDRVVHLLRQLTNLGYDVDDLDEKKLTVIAKEIKEAKHVVRLKASTSKDGDYVNVRINKVMTDMDADEVLDGAGSVDDTEGSAEDEDATPAKKTKAKAKVEPEEEDAEAEAEEDAEEEPKPKAKKKAAPAAEEEEEDADAEEDEKPKTKTKVKGKAKPADEEEEVVEDAEEDAEEAGTALKVGTKCSVKIKGVTHKVVVVSIDYDEEKALVKSSTDGKKYKVDPSKLTP